MKLSLTIYSVAQLVEQEGMTVEKFLEFASSVGFTGVDLGYFWQDKKKEMAKLSGWLEKYGLVVSGAITRSNFGAVVGTPQLQEQINLVKEAIEDARMMAAPSSRIFAGGREGLSFQEGAPLIADCFLRLTEEAEKKKVVLALEDHHGLAATAEHLLYYLNRVNSPYFRLNVDIANFLFDRDDPVQATRQTAAYAVMVHVKDAKRQGEKVAGCLLGQGEVDVKGCLMALKEAGYSGYLSLEYEVAENPRTGIPFCYHYLKRLETELNW
ncbi:MAG TPA: sugar phosphate isomerase/epimerase family protein [bacterium]|nr:sugar phosphate isomerase/epimerase family protein [bacterium]